MEKKELEKLREENATKIAESLYERLKENVYYKICTGNNKIDLYIDEFDATQEFNYLVCIKLSRLFEDLGYYCEYSRSMYQSGCYFYIYPGKPKLNWWQKIFG